MSFNCKWTQENFSNYYYERAELGDKVAERLAGQCQAELVPKSMGSQGRQTKDRAESMVKKSQSWKDPLVTKRIPLG